MKRNTKIIMSILAGLSMTSMTFAADYTLSQVQTHNTQSDCWTIVNGKVYNITSYVPFHPGGVASIVAICGKDGNALFAGQYSGSTGANNSLNALLVGNLVTSTGTTSTGSTSTGTTSTGTTSTGSTTSTGTTEYRDNEREDDEDGQDHDKKNEDVKKHRKEIEKEMHKGVSDIKDKLEHKTQSGSTSDKDIRNKLKNEAIKIRDKAQSAKLQQFGKNVGLPSRATSSLERQLSNLFDQLDRKNDAAAKTATLNAIVAKVDLRLASITGTDTKSLLTKNVLNLIRQSVTDEINNVVNGDTDIQIMIDEMLKVK